MKGGTNWSNTGKRGWQTLCHVELLIRTLNKLPLIGLEFPSGQTQKFQMAAILFFTGWIFGENQIRPKLSSPHENFTLSHSLSLLPNFTFSLSYKSTINSILCNKVSPFLLSSLSFFIWCVFISFSYLLPLHIVVCYFGPVNSSLLVHAFRN